MTIALTKPYSPLARPHGKLHSSSNTMDLIHRILQSKGRFFAVYCDMLFRVVCTAGMILLTVTHHKYLPVYVCHCKCQGFYIFIYLCESNYQLSSSPSGCNFNNMFLLYKISKFLLGIYLF